LYRYLIAHPNVARSAHKEVHFFDREYHRGLEWYRSAFPAASERGKVTGPDGGPPSMGEASPTYLFDRDVPERVARDVPDARFIVLLRDPVERAHSQYRMALGKGVEHLPFDQALEAEAERLGADPARVAAGDRTPTEEAMRFSYRARGVYADQLERWFARFPRGRFLIEESERLFEDPEGVFGDALRFLDLPAWQPEGYQVHNAWSGEPMSAEARERLRRWFEPHNRRLTGLLGRSFRWTP
jgi:hypothetical protein